MSKWDGTATTLRLPMGYPLLPLLQPGKSCLMIAVGGMGEEESEHQVACFCSGVLCHSFLWGGAHPSHMVGLDLLHKHRPPQPPVCLHQLCSVNTLWIKLLWWHCVTFLWWPSRVVEIFPPPCCITSTLNCAANPHSSQWPLKGETVWE